MSNNREASASTWAALFQVVFSLNFPLMLFVVGATSYALQPDLPQFSWWADLDKSVESTLWGRIGGGIWFFGQFPLAWLAFREHSTRASDVVGMWVGAAIVTGITVFAAASWPNNGSEFQKWVFAFLLFFSVGAIYEAIFSSLKLRSQMRANRPLPPPTHQQPHGSRDEPDTI
jgi:hypothetical protein